MKRGDVFWADLVPRSGSEQTGRRPVVVISHDSFNFVETWRSVIVVPLSTSALRANRAPTVVTISAGIAGLTRSSVAVCHQITTLDRSKLTKRIGTVPSDILSEIELGVKAAIDVE